MTTRKIIGISLMASPFVGIILYIGLVFNDFRGILESFGITIFIAGTIWVGINLITIKKYDNKKDNLQR